MNPTELLDLASRLISDGTEAAFRAAVSRAYYGAFHSAVLLIKEMGVSLPVGPESHQKVRFCLMESAEAPALQAGDSLQVLRKHRNQADYDLDESTLFDAPNTLRRIQRAREILGQLKACREEPIRSRFRVKVRALRNERTEVARRGPIGDEWESHPSGSQTGQNDFVNRSARSHRKIADHVRSRR